MRVNCVSLKFASIQTGPPLIRLKIGAPFSTTAGARSVTKDASGNITAYNVGADGKFSQPIHFKVMIHRIHTGENLDLTKNNANGTVSFFIESPANDFSDVKYPRDRRECSA